MITRHKVFVFVQISFKQIISLAFEVFLYLFMVGSRTYTSILIFQILCLITLSLYFKFCV